MAEYRTVKMSFWQDPYIEELPADGKLLYLYLFTCPYANNLGIVETTLKRISYETGIDLNRIDVLLNEMERAGKIMRDATYIWLTHFIKHQCSTSPKLLISLKAALAEVPSKKIRHALCLRYPHIFECSESEMKEADTISEKQITVSSKNDTVPKKEDIISIPYEYPMDTVPIPSGEIGNRNMEVGNRNMEGGINPRTGARARETHPKKRYGNFQKVLLTEDEHEKLIEQFGEIEAEDLITRLDGYIASKGDKYKSHYATMLNWDRKDKKEQQAMATASRTESLTEHNKAVARQVLADLDAIDAPF